MNIRTNDKLNKIIAPVLILGGLFLSFQSAALYYNYTFTSKLYFFMYPLTAIVISFLLGLISMIAGSLLLRRKSNSLLFLYLFSFGAVFNFFNELTKDYPAFLSGIDRIIIITLAILVIIYFNHPKVLDVLDKKSRKKELVLGLIFGLTINIVPTLIFQNYLYS
jgi:hypothetical protein